MIRTLTLTLASTLISAAAVMACGDAAVKTAANANCTKSEGVVLASADGQCAAKATLASATCAEGAKAEGVVFAKAEGQAAGCCATKAQPAVASAAQCPVEAAKIQTAMANGACCESAAKAQLAAVTVTTTEAGE